MKRYLMYKSIMKYLTDKDLSLNAKGFLSMILFNDEINDLELLVPNFKVASAIIHYDETSPHLHIVGVPIKYKNKNGMENKLVNQMYLLKNL